MPANDDRRARACKLITVLLMLLAGALSVQMRAHADAPRSGAVAGVGGVGAFSGIGRVATAAEIQAWDIDVRPDFQGLPKGSGTVLRGLQIWDAKCASCHGTFGELTQMSAPITGGTTAADIRLGKVAALANPNTVQRSTLMKLATISTLWDYLYRAMPWNAPKSLSVDDTYAVTAYILNLAEIVPDDFSLSDQTIHEVQSRLPNRLGMTRDHGLGAPQDRPDTANTRCMKDCAGKTPLRASISGDAMRSHGNLSEQNRSFGPVRGIRQISGAGPSD